MPQEEVAGGGRVPGSHAGRVAAVAHRWRSMLKVSKGFSDMLTHGLLDLPTEPCWGLPPMGAVPQSDEDLEFGRQDLEAGCLSGVYQKVSAEESEELVRKGYLISSAFTIWQGDPGSRKGRFVLNFSRQSKFWGKGSVRMERLEEFADEIVEGERLLSFDLAAGYRHVHLHPLMWDYFLFSYAGQVYRCLALPFGWGRSAAHFTRFLRPVVTYMRNVLGYRVLWYLDDFLIAPGRGGGGGESCCLRASKQMDFIMLRLGLKRHQTKGVWGSGATELTHLGFHLSTLTMRFTVPPPKQQRMRRMANKLLRQRSHGKGFVSAPLLTTFCGMAVSLTLAVPLARFHTRSLYDALTYSRRERGRKGDSTRERVRISKTAANDLRYWRHLGPEGRCMREATPDACTHSDAADLGWGGTFSRDFSPGSPGRPVQGWWDVIEKNKTIAFRELRALRLVLAGFCQATRANQDLRPPPTRDRRVVCWVDNAAVVYIVRAMVTASTELMPELRLLQKLLQREHLALDVRWISSAVNRHADRLSRTWDPTSPQLSRAVTASLTASLNEWVGRGQVFRYRLSGGEHPVAQRKSAEAALQEFWGDSRARFYNPPPELLGVTLSKMAREGARGVVVVPLWIETQSVARLRRMAERTTTMYPKPGSPLVVGAREGTETCPLLVAEVGLYRPCDGTRGMCVVRPKTRS